MELPLYLPDESEPHGQEQLPAPVQQQGRTVAVKVQNQLLHLWYQGSGCTAPTPAPPCWGGWKGPELPCHDALWYLRPLPWPCSL